MLMSEGCYTAEETVTVCSCKVIGGQPRGVVTRALGEVVVVFVDFDDEPVVGAASARPTIE